MRSSCFSTIFAILDRSKQRKSWLMIKTISSLVFALLLSNLLVAQSPIATYELELKETSTTLLTDSLLDHRVKAHNEIKTGLSNVLKNEGSFAHPFDSIKHISIQYPKDSSFRIFSWQLYQDLDHYLYGGILQEKNTNRITVLEDQRAEILDPEFDVVNASEWYGAVYYNIHDFDHKDGKAYLLFGLNSYKMLENQKIVDVLTLTDKGPKFGAAVFFKPEGLKAEKRRLVYTYSAEASFRLTFEPSLDLVIFDHLAPGRSIRGTSVWVPDGTYMGYKLIDQKWVYQEKLFHEVLSEAPIEVPVLNTRRNKDIFGEEQKVKNKLAKASTEKGKGKKKRKKKKED